MNFHDGYSNIKCNEHLLDVINLLASLSHILIIIVNNNSVSYNTSF